ncbi:MAG: isoprenylcysteine carboxylmethyltransferase family protein [Candidatus Sericytochromatia bacterium]|nr:isoprenylcysteine carboxylmethyltransferase family protein [Candidatus Tanganyikabacteria bacterium]
MADVALARRYAGGTRSLDGSGWALLSASLLANIALAVACGWLGLFPISWRPDLVAPAGVALGLAGLAIRYGAIATLGRQFTWRVTILDDHRLIEHGPFAWIRHPGYSGGLLAAYGIFLGLGTWLPVLTFSLTYVPLVLWRIRAEEAALERHFGEAYVAYRDKARALIPWVL